jgi:chemotaxis protein methyltransferase CheR
VVHYPSGAANTAEKVVGALATLAVGQSPELSDSDFFRFCQLVHQHAGIHLTSQKKELVRARLTKVLRQRGLSTFREYYELVMQDASGAELMGFLDALSTNQTAFWREPKHFEYLAGEVLPAWLKDRQSPLKRNLWSAGCSSGEEPYTLAILMMNTFPGEDLSQVKIFASDINTQVLAQAERGIYPISRVEPLPPEWRQRYFQKGVRERQPQPHGLLTLSGKHGHHFLPQCHDLL